MDETTLRFHAARLWPLVGEDFTAEWNRFRHWSADLATGLLESDEPTIELDLRELDGIVDWITTTRDVVATEFWQRLPEQCAGFRAIAGGLVDTGAEHLGASRPDEVADLQRVLGQFVENWIVPLAESPALAALATSGGAPDRPSGESLHHTPSQSPTSRAPAPAFAPSPSQASVTSTGVGSSSSELRSGVSSPAMTPASSRQHIDAEGFSDDEVTEEARVRIAERNRANWRTKERGGVVEYHLRVGASREDTYLLLGEGHDAALVGGCHHHGRIVVARKGRLGHLKVLDCPSHAQSVLRGLLKDVTKKPFIAFENGGGEPEPRPDGPQSGRPDAAVAHASEHRAAHDPQRKAVRFAEDADSARELAEGLRRRMRKVDDPAARERARRRHDDKAGEGGRGAHRGTTPSSNPPRERT